MSSGRVVTAVIVAAVVAASCSSSPGPQPSAAPSLARTASADEPYPFDRPAPPRKATAIDGAYARRVTIEQAGGKPSSCRRCAPYRLDAGRTRLTLDRGRFYVQFDPVTDSKRCPECAGIPGFTARAHFEVRGNRLVLFNDANCIDEPGTYEWSIDGDALVLTEVDDPCLTGLRERFLTTFDWRRQM